MGANSSKGLSFGDGGAVHADCGRVGLLRLDLGGRLLGGNPFGLSLLHEGSGALQLQDGRVIARKPQEQRKWTQILAVPLPGTRAFLVGRGDADELAIRFHYLPDEAGWSVHFTETRRFPVPSTRLLGSLYELTRAEAELAVLLASGRTLQEASESRQVSLATVRCQLQRILHKVGATRQAELGLILGRIALLRDPETSEVRDQAEPEMEVIFASEPPSSLVRDTSTKTRRKRSYQESA